MRETITLIHGEGALESVKCEAASGRPSHEAIDVQLKDFFAKETEARMADGGDLLVCLLQRIIYQSRFEPSLTCLIYQVF